MAKGEERWRRAVPRRGVLSRPADAYLLVLGIVGVSCAVIVAASQPADAGGDDVTWPVVSAVAIGVVSIAALWVVFDSISISIRKFGDRSMGRTRANLRALAAFVVPATYFQAAALIGVPAPLVFGVIGGALTAGVAVVV